ncbi:MAG TPA: hypothetical protein DC049_18320 [Spirochaetia bacterium]|nr:hypothetical protein [Spirochaetia bacterium]
MIFSDMMRSFIIIYLSAVLCNASGTITTARVGALANGFYAFSDDASALYFNPALMYYVPTARFEIAHIPLFLNNTRETMQAVYKKKRLVFGGSLLFCHSFINLTDYNDLNYSVINGIPVDSGLADYDINASGGASMMIIKNLCIRLSAEAVFHKLYYHNYFDTILRIGTSYALPVKENLLRAGISAEIPFIGTTRTGSFAFSDGLKMSAGIYYQIKKISSSAGIQFLYDEPQMSLGAQASASSVTGIKSDYAERKMVIGAAVEALRDWYLVPRASIGFPTDNFREVHLNWGAGAGILLGSYRYEVHYSIGRVFNVRRIEGFKHTVSIGVVKPVAREFFVPRHKFFLSESACQFYDLARDFPRSSEKQELIPPQNRLSMTVAAYPSGYAADPVIAACEKSARLLLEEMIDNNVSFEKKDRGFDLSLVPRITIAGEILRFSVNVFSKNNQLVFSTTHDADFHRDPEENMMVKVSRFYAAENTLAPVTVFHDSAVRKNQSEIESVMEKFRTKFFDYLDKNFLCRVSVQVNILNALIYIDNAPVAWSEGKPLVLFLKPGKHTFKAAVAGWEDISLEKNIDKETAVDIKFPLNRFYTDLELSLLGNDTRSTAEIAGRRYDFTGSMIVSNVPNTEKFITVRSGLAVKKIPLNITERKIYSINLLAEINDNFSGPGDIWQPVVTSSNFNCDFSARGLSVTGSAEGGRWKGSGIMSKPFFLDSLSLDFSVERKREGDFSFFIIFNNGKKITVLFNNKGIYAVSDFRSRTIESDNPLLVKVRQLLSKKITVKLEIRRNVLEIYENNDLLYSAEIDENRMARLFFAADSEKNNEKIDFILRSIRCRAN